MRSRAWKLVPAAALLITGLVTPGAGADEKPATGEDRRTGAAQPLTIKTWNMCGDKDKPGCGISPDETEKRIREVVERADHEHDVIMLQETCGALHYPRILDGLRASGDWMGNFWRKPKGPGEFKPCGIEGGGYIGSAIFLRNPSSSASKQDLHFEGTDIPFRRWGAACLGDPGRDLYVCSTHFPPPSGDPGGTVRKALLREATDHLETVQAGYRTVFGGDFNIDTQEPTQDSWLDRFRQHSLGGSRIPTHDNGAAVDHIFAGSHEDWNLHSQKVYASALSDHNMLVQTVMPTSTYAADLQ